MFLMKEFELIKAVLIFLAVIVSDTVWIFYIRRAAEGKAVQAAFFGAMIWIFGAFVVVGYVENQWYLIPAVLGALIGTYAAVKFDKKKNRGKKF